MSEIEHLFEEASRLRLSGDSAGARPLIVRAAALARGGDDQDQLGRMLAKLGQVERDLENGTAALACYGEAAEIARRSGDQAALAHRLRHIGDIHQDAGALEAAEHFYEEALALYRSRDDAAVLDVANAVRPMAELREKQGRADEALILTVEAGALYAQAGVPAGAEECARRAERLGPKS